MRDAGTVADLSAESAAAFSVARSIAERFGGSVRAIAAHADQLDREAAHAITSELEEQPGRAVDLLAAASDSADLVIVGSRGLHGLKALGSVSERVAQRARSSVVVAGPDLKERWGGCRRFSAARWTRETRSLRAVRETLEPRRALRAPGCRGANDSSQLERAICSCPR